MSTKDYSAELPKMEGGDRKIEEGAFLPCDLSEDNFTDFPENLIEMYLKLLRKPGKIEKNAQSEQPRALKNDYLRI